MRTQFVRWIGMTALVLAGAACTGPQAPMEPAQAQAEPAAVTGDTPAVPIDHGVWDGVLKQHVSRGRIHRIELAVVDYAALKNDAAYKTYLEQLAKADVSKLGPEDLMAFWINAYNALCIKVVLDHLPLESINDAGGKLIDKVWDKPAGEAAGKMRTLNEIEHEILRKMGDPRIHAAIVCASVSCPDLRPEAYVGSQLDAQLDEQVGLWLANPGKGMRLDREAKTLTLSAIFDWFEDDFVKASGSVPDFVARHAPAADRPFVEQNKADLSVSHFDYDWALNDKAKAEPAGN